MLAELELVTWHVMLLSQCYELTSKVNALFTTIFHMTVNYFIV